MSTEDDWIPVKLSPELMARATMLATARNTHGTQIGARRIASAEIHRIRDIHGYRGEIATALYLGEPLPGRATTWAEDVAKGHDVGGYAVRCRPYAQYDLAGNRGDKGPFLLCLGHQAPIIWLVGEIDTEDAYRCARWRMDGDNRNGGEFWIVDKSHLTPLPERNGYHRRRQAEPVSDLQRCRILELGREGCGCITCRRELTVSAG